MRKGYLSRLVLTISSLGVLTALTACMGDEPGERPATTLAVASRRSGAVSASDLSPSHEVAVTDGRVRLTAARPPSTVAVQPAVASGSAAIDLETVAAWCGNTALDVTVIGADHAAPGVITIVRADLVETIENSSDGIEQSWRFEQTPGDAGDLVIAVGTTDLEYLGSDDSGLHLRRASELDVRYGHGTWIDRNGDASAVPARYEGGRILLTVPTAVVAGSTFPAVLDPQIIVTPIT